MRWKLFLLVVTIVMMCSTTLNAANSKTATFQGTVDQVFNAAVKAAQSKWRVTFLDRETKTLTFDGNSELDCNIAVEEMPDSSGVRVTWTAHRKSGGTTWGTTHIAEQFFKAIEEQLSKTKQSQ